MNDEQVVTVQDENLDDLLKMAVAQVIFRACRCYRVDMDGKSPFEAWDEAVLKMDKIMVNRLLALRETDDSAVLNRLYCSLEKRLTVLLEKEEAASMAVPAAVNLAI